MKNLEIAKILHEIANLLEIRRVQFKPAAYRRAAMSIESLNKDIIEIAKKGKLKDIPGVGASIAEKIIEFLKTGKVKLHQKLKKSLPIKINELASVSGMGPKTIKVLYEKIKIKNLAELKRAAKQGKIRKIGGLGQTVEENILQGIEIVKTAKKRMLLGLVIPLAEEIKERVESIPGVKRVVIAGSYRRRKETVRDLDILAISKQPGKVVDTFCSFPEVKSVRAKGALKASVRLKNGINVDLYVLQENKFGSALNYFTGSKEHNIELRKLALKKGLTLSEHGLTKVKSKKLVAAKTEEVIYERLGMQYIPPELRENRGEIEAALKRKIPRLVTKIKGDLHMHTTWSDGDDTIEEMARAAQKLGYKFIAISDHAGPLKIANSLDEKRITKYLKAIDRVQKKVKIKILKSLEVDIKKNGDLSIKKQTLKKLDLVLGAIHSGFKTPDMTKRICTALENNHINILTHPSGRVIQKRAPYSLNFDKLFETAKATNTFLEVDAFPNRLDLTDVNIKAAIEAGCKIAINSDAHNINQIHFSTTIGVPWARRGWATEKDVLNCWNLKKIKKALKN
ncbi:DNA polymerase/3'-5' exonuclease PolX [Candidatus Woesearchaeota archaeon]|nr:DNA polymerase/3'-5' exonuclease PolX [Candidatus Woesearchaeota archaeon]